MRDCRNLLLGRSRDLEQGSLHSTPEHCLVNGGFPLFGWKKPCFNWAKCIALLRLADLEGPYRSTVFQHTHTMFGTFQYQVVCKVHFRSSSSKIATLQHKSSTRSTIMQLCFGGVLILLQGFVQFGHAIKPLLIVLIKRYAQVLAVAHI